MNGTELIHNYFRVCLFVPIHQPISFRINSNNKKVSLVDWKEKKPFRHYFREKGNSQLHSIGIIHNYIRI